MPWRRPAAYLAFALGILLLTAAFAAFLAPLADAGEGMMGLGLVVLAMMMAGLSGAPLALAAWLSNGRPRWLLVGAAIGCSLALFAGIAFFATPSTGGMLFGILFFASGAIGLAGVAKRWKRP